MKASPFQFCYITCPDKKLALHIGRALLKQNLIACANIIPGMESLYVWQGKTCHDHEVVLILKSRKNLFQKISRAVKALHPYECPCIVALPIIAGERNYLTWMKQQLKSALK